MLKCKNCGSENLEPSDKILTSFPPIFVYVCKDCGSETHTRVLESAIDKPIEFPVLEENPWLKEIERLEKKKIYEESKSKNNLTGAYYPIIDKEIKGVFNETDSISNKNNKFIKIKDTVLNTDNINYVGISIRELTEGEIRKETFSVYVAFTNKIDIEIKCDNRQEVDDILNKIQKNEY